MDRPKSHPATADIEHRLNHRSFLWLHTLHRGLRMWQLSLAEVCYVVSRHFAHGGLVINATGLDCGQ